MTATLPILKEEVELDGTPIYIVRFTERDVRYSVGFHTADELLDALIGECLDERCIERVFGFVSDSVDETIERYEMPPQVSVIPLRWVVTAFVVGVLIKVAFELGGV